MAEHLEVVSFSIRDGEREPFLAKRDAAITALREAYPALLEARLAEYEDGTWIDVVRWRSLDDARAAAEGMPTVDAARAWAAHIAEVRDLRHARLHHVADGAAV